MKHVIKTFQWYIFLISASKSAVFMLSSKMSFAVRLNWIPAKSIALSVFTLKPPVKFNGSNVTFALSNSCLFSYYYNVKKEISKSIRISHKSVAVSLSKETSTLLKSLWYIICSSFGSFRYLYGGTIFMSLTTPQIHPIRNAPIHFTSWLVFLFQGIAQFEFIVPFQNKKSVFQCDMI